MRHFRRFQFLGLALILCVALAILSSHVPISTSRGSRLSEPVAATWAAQNVVTQNNLIGQGLPIATNYFWGPVPVDGLQFGGVFQITGSVTAGIPSTKVALNAAAQTAGRGDAVEAANFVVQQNGADPA